MDRGEVQFKFIKEADPQLGNIRPQSYLMMTMVRRIIDALNGVRHRHTCRWWLVAAMKLMKMNATVGRRVF